MRDWNLFSNQAARTMPLGLEPTYEGLELSLVLAASFAMILFGAYL